MGTFNDIELDDLEVTGPRLLLRRWRADDADRVREVMQDRSMFDYLPLPDPYTAGAATAFVTDLGHEGRGEGSGLGCAVVARDTGQVVGSAALRFGGDPEIGYWVAPDARGHGFAAEATAVLAGLGLDRLGLPRVRIDCDVRNLASVRTALAAGFRWEGTARAAAPVAGRGPGDLARFSRLPEDPAGPIAPSFPPLPAGGLGDGVITLRPLAADDGDELAETENDAVSVAVGFSGEPTPVERFRRTAEHGGFDWLVGGAAHVAVVDDATGAFAGSVTLRHAGPPSIFGIGYAVHPLFRGRGYTSRALRLIAPWAFAHGIARLELGAKVGNIGSQRAALAAGFEPDGVRRHRLRNGDGSFSDEARFALLPPDQSTGAAASSPNRISP